MHKIISEINAYCEKNRVVGFHYTRANPNDISQRGLLCRSGAEIRDQFIVDHGNLFTSNEIEEIMYAWKYFFNNRNAESRDYRIYFNFTKNELNKSGSKLLLNNYGGEQVYFPLHQLNGIAEKLQALGKPMLLKCSLKPKNLNTYISCPWGKIAVSSYHRRINANSYIVDQDGYQCKSIAPEQIEIIPL